MAQQNMDTVFGFVSDSQKPVCMVMQITKAMVVPVSMQSGINFKVNDYCLTSGFCGTTKIHGPFKTLEQALESGAKNHKVEIYTHMTFEDQT